MALDISDFTSEMRSRSTDDPLFARMSLMMDRVQDHINQIGSLTGVDSGGHTTPPDPPSAINVKAANGVAHVTLNDSSQRSRALNYFVEADTDPAFSNPKHIEHMGASRSKFITLPGLTDGNSTQPWYFRAYSMALGSQQASAHQYFGGSANPTPVTVGGSAQLTPLAGTGSGTGSTNGQQAGQGFGTSQYANPQ